MAREDDRGACGAGGRARSSGGASARRPPRPTPCDGSPAEVGADPGHAPAASRAGRIGATAVARPFTRSAEPRLSAGRDAPATGGERRAPRRGMRGVAEVRRVGSAARSGPVLGNIPAWPPARRHGPPHRTLRSWVRAMAMAPRCADPQRSSIRRSGRSPDGTSLAVRDKRAAAPRDSAARGAARDPLPATGPPGTRVGAAGSLRQPPVQHVGISWSAVAPTGDPPGPRRPDRRPGPPPRRPDARTAARGPPGSGRPARPCRRAGPGPRRRSARRGRLDAVRAGTAPAPRAGPFPGDGR